MMVLYAMGNAALWQFWVWQGSMQMISISEPFLLVCFSKSLRTVIIRFVTCARADMTTPQQQPVRLVFVVSDAARVAADQLQNRA